MTTQAETADTAVTFTVHGHPAPQGSKRAFARAGKAWVVEMAGDRLVSWREAVRGEAQRLVADQGVRFPSDMPLHVVLEFTLTTPKSAPKRRRIWPIGRRDDIDKLVRGTLDALTDSGLIPDDGQVVSLVASKDYDRWESRTPGCRIVVGAWHVWRAEQDRLREQERAS
jgi:crossover junction endodeoxyribonuclease RusA